MKITHCIFTMKTGGAQILLVDLLNGLNVNNELHLIIVNNEFEEDILSYINQNIKIHFIKRPKGSKNPYYILKLNYLLSRIKSDIINIHEVNMVNFILKNNSKLVLTIHDISHKLKSLSRIDLLVSISKAVSNDVFLRYNKTSKIINNGVEMQLFQKKKIHKIHFEKNIKIVQLSRLMHQKKGQDVLINSIAEVEKLVPNYKFQIDFIGSGPSESYLIELIEKIKIKSVFNFLGNKNKKWLIENLSNYDLLVQPSLYEGFGLTIIEGFSAGLPVIASNIDGPQEILNTLNFDFTFTVNSPKECANKIISIINLYEQSVIKKLVFDSYNKLFKKYDIKNTINGYQNCYSVLINN